MKKYKTEQEGFWNGEFGNEYTTRNTEEIYLSKNIALFASILNRTLNIRSVIEFGSNIGLNLKAIKTLLPNAELTAIEINRKAVVTLKNNFEKITLHNESILAYKPSRVFDFVLIKGVLIHINPLELNNVYQKLYDSSGRYICLAEYYNPSPVEVKYRGFKNKLFKRDFARELLDKFVDLILLDYGFVYHRDNNFPQDDLTWFLLEKKRK
jgi:spore coat polysaccharide biosynthesis protein SpsF